MKITLTDSSSSVTVQPRTFTVTLSGARGPAGQGLPAGGAEGQIIVKQSATDYDTAWADNYATNVELYVKNSTAGAMTKGQVVYVSGADGNNPTITLAIATSEAGSSKTIGVLKQNIAVGALGYVVTDGLLEGLNTNAASVAGDTIWLSPTTAGGVVYGTANKPSAPNHMVFIGYVLRKNQNNGKIFVKIQNGFELQELHNVAISNPVTGQVLKYNGTTGLWSNDTDAGGINTLNTLTASSQTFATGTSGTDFGIVSATGTHTFNLPTASASARGLLSSTDWSTFNGKQGALTLTTTGSSGAATLVGNTLNIPQYSGGTALTLTTTGTSGAATLVGDTLNIPQYQAALTNPVTGTGTSGQVAYFNGTSAVTGSANLFWDNANGRLTVGTNASVAARLAIRGSGTTSATTALLVQNGTPSELFKVLDNGAWNHNGDGTISGSGNSSATIALAVKNSDSNSILTVRNDGRILLGTTTSAIIAAMNRVTTGASVSGEGIFFNSNGNTAGVDYLFSGNNITATSGALTNLLVQKNFLPTSGTATFSIFNIASIINQTGGANGITRGLYVNPILTAAADWRSLEWSNNTGWGLYGAGSANNYLAGDTAIGTTTTSGGRLTVRGSGTTSATTALLVQNSTPTTLLQVLDNGRISQTLVGSLNSTAFGTSALSVATGAFNIAFGGSALEFTTSGINNNAFGFRALRNNTTGVNNTAFGHTALNGSTTASNNTAFGNSALLNITGSNNTAFGSESGSYAGSGTTANQTSSNSIYVGYRSRAGASGNTNETVIGYNVVGNGSNTTTIGNASTTNNYIYGNFNIIDINIVLGTTTGTKIGTATSQKLSFWNATPVAQPTTAIAEATFTENSGGTAVNVDSTFAGYTLQQIAQALKDIGILQ